jgi:mycoredoxin
MENPSKIIVYSTPWCPDCSRARRILIGSGIEFIEINVSKDKEAAEVVKSMNGGNRSVPTIIFPDGSFLVEPSSDVLSEKLQQYQL